MRTFFWIGLCMAVTLQAGRAADEYRVFTNQAGVEIRAKLIALENGQATIKREDGLEFTIPTTSFSEEDQKFILQAGAALASGFITRSGPNDNLAPDVLNELIGAPLFSDTVLWQDDVESLAKKLDIRPESKTRVQSSFRSYPRDEARLFGARPFSIALYGAAGKPTRFSMVFANKGDSFGAAGSAEDHFDRTEIKDEDDALEFLEKVMEKDVEIITETLASQLGEPEKQRFGEGEGRRTVYRWDWRGHAILLSEVDEEYVGVEVATQAFADAGGRSERVDDAVVREQAAANIERRENGDVVVTDIPMVDQGPKGYCVPATAERAMRYLGVPADMYILAMAGETSLGGGTNVNRLLDAVGSDIRRKGRSFDSWNGEMKMRELKKHLDRGVPVMWTLFSSDEWNRTANNRTDERKSVSDWTAWTEKMNEITENANLAKDRDSGHVVLIMGYNETTGEIAFSDSWGNRYMERWMTLAEAENVSQGGFWVVGF